MFSDIKGYSRMMGANESVALHLLDEHNKIVVPLIETNDGTVLKFIGDAVFSTFESAADAVRSAIAIQQALSARNTTAPPDRQILIRIGIHVGDVVLKDNDAFGDGVNIAARIEPLAEPGGIAISQTVYDMVKARPELQLVNLGPKELKNIKEAMNIYKVLIEANTGASPESSSPKPTVPPARNGRLVVIGILALAALGIGSIFLMFKRPPSVAIREPRASPSNSAPAEVPSSPAALAFKQGMQAFSDGTASSPLFKKAIELDPSLASATFHQAMELRQRDVTQARANFRATVLNRDQLPEFDRALFTASDPFFFDPPGFAEWEKRMTDVVAKYPKEPRAGYYLGESRRLQGNADGAVAAYKTVHAIAPGFAPAYSREALTLRLTGKVAEANATLDQCIQSAPYGIVCIVERANAASDAGECSQFLTHSRNAVSVSPDNYSSYMLLSMALEATGQSIESVRTALAQKRKYSTEPAADAERADKIRLAMLAGDFEAVIPLATEAMTSAEANAADLSKLSVPAHFLAEAYEELGDMKGLRDVANRFLADADSFTANSMAVTGDLGLARLEFERDRVVGGEKDRSQLDAARTAYLNTQKSMQGTSNSGGLAIAWAQGFGMAALTRDDAMQALAAQASFGPPPPGGWDPVAARFAGKLKLLAGSAAEAIPLLEKGALACNALRYPHENTRAWLRLGEARAATGDKAGAKTAYAVVLTRWGAAKKSATAQEAKDRLAALGE